MKKLKDYYKENELGAKGTIFALFRAYADQPNTLLVSVEEFYEIVTAFEVEADWDGKIWGMKLMIEK